MKLTNDRFKLFLYKYSILPPLFGFALGIVLYDYLPGDTVWLFTLSLGVVFGLIALLSINFKFLIFIPLGLLFAWNPADSGSGVEQHLDTSVDVEGVLYKSPEQRQYGSRLFIDTDSVVKNGQTKNVRGKVIINSSELTEGLASGDRVRVIGTSLRELRSFQNPGGFDFKSFYERQGIRAIGFTEGKEYVISFGRDSSSIPVLHYIDGVRMKFASYVNSNFEFPESAVLNAITVGYRGGIPTELREEFSRAGVAHVLAISGLHVGAVAVFFYFLLRLVLTRSDYFLLHFQVPRITAGLTIIPVFLYTAVAGFSTSAVRAFIMITLYLISVVIGRDENKINTLGAAALIILIWHPWALFELSFRLSFSAVLGILLVHKFYPFRFGTLNDKLHSLVKSTIAAGFATLPIVANSFGILPLVSIPANLILVPFIEFLIIPLGLISLLAFIISPYLSEPFVALNIILLEVVVFWIGKLNELPYSYVLMPRINPLSWALFIASGVTLLIAGRYKKLIYIFPVILLGFMLSVTASLYLSSSGGGTEINVLDTADNRSAVFITLPDRTNVLITGGYKRADGSGYTERTVIAPYLLSRGVRNIDNLILTSTDKDHMEGARYLLENFKVDKFYTNGDRLEGGIWENLYGRAIEWQDLLETDRVYLSDHYSVEIIKPGGGFVIKDSALPYPLALKITGPELSFLTGEGLHLEEVQNSLLDQGTENLKSAVLYMPMVRENESLYSLLKAVSPKVLVTGDLETDRLGFKDISSSLYETTQSGTVTIESDNAGLDIKTYTGD